MGSTCADGWLVVGATTSTGAGGAAGAGPGVAFVAAAFLAGLAGASAAGAAAGRASLSLRTTGGSTVDDADRTNSPSSLSLVMTTLLSRPSSLASS